MQSQGECKPKATEDFFENVYEKWLRRRLHYACIRETGGLAAPGLVHVMLHKGDTHNAVASQLRHTMWRECRYPDQKFFQHGQVLYNYPPMIRELLDLRFANQRSGDPRRGRIPTMPWDPRRAYNLSFHEVTTVPNWLAPLHISDCPFPHMKETPTAWTLGNEVPQVPKIYTRSEDPTRINLPAYPACCKHKDEVCSAVYCADPLPEAVYNPGPMGKGDALIKWHLDACFRGK